MRADQLQRMQLQGNPVQQNFTEVFHAYAWMAWDCIVSDARVLSPFNSREEENATLENKIQSQIISRLG